MAVEHDSPARSRRTPLTGAVASGLALALAQPLPYAAVLAANRALAPDDHAGRPSEALSLYWASPVRWLAVTAFTLTIAVLLTRFGRPSGVQVGGTLAATVGAYVLVGSIGAAVVDGDATVAVVDVALSIGLYYTAWLAVLVGVATCWWARRFG